MKENKINSYKDLIVWQKSMDLVTEVYKLTEHYPGHEMYGLTAHTRKTAVSVPSNIAEGKYRGTKKDFAQFLRVAFGSGAELETQLAIAKRLEKTKNLDYSRVDRLLEEVMKMLNVFIRKLST